MLKIFDDFERRPDLLARFDALLPVWSISCVFADVMYRTQVMTSAIKPPFKAKAVGQALTVQLSKGDLVDPLKALEMGQAGDIIVVDCDQRKLEVEVSDAELADRLSKVKRPEPRYKTGVFAKYAASVSSAARGAVTVPKW